MPTLNIDGRKVTVGDEFLKLSPEEQNAAVDEIAQSMPKAKPSRGIVSAITDIPSEIGSAASAAIDKIAALKNRGMQGPVEGVMTTGRAALAIPELALSPLTGTARAIGGNLMTQAEHGFGSLINPKVAAKDDLNKMYETAKGDTDLAMAALGSRGVPVRPAPAPFASPNPGIIDAAQRLSGVAGDVNVPVALASDSTAIQRIGQGLRNIPVVGDAIPQATGRLVDELGTATRAIADQYGPGASSGPNVAHSIGERLRLQAEAEAAAARQSDEAVKAAWARDVEAANAGVANREAQAAQSAEQAVGGAVNPQDMGATLISRLRQGEQAARANKERLYDVAGQSDGAIHHDAIGTLRSDVLSSLDKNGVVVDPVVNGHSLTPAAARMIAELDNVPGARIQDRFVSAPVQGRAAPSAAAAPAGSAPSAAAAPGAKSLLEFLAEKGGLGPDAELGAIGAHGHTVNVEGVGRRKLVRQGGLPLDYAREAAEEAGYLRGDHRGTATVNDLLDAISAEIGGQRRFPEGFEGTVGKRERVARSEREQHEYDAFRRGIDEDLAKAGYSNLNPDIRQRAIDLMTGEKLDAKSAVEQAILQAEQGDAVLGGTRPQSQAPVDMQTLEQTRKRLNALSRSAANDGDRRAATNVMRAFDDWLNNAFDRALFSGSDEAIQSFKAARAANTEWRHLFYNNENDAGKIINQIATGEVTPQQVANYIIGSGQVGAKGVSSRLLTSIAEATGNDPELMQAIRGGLWSRLSRSTEGTAAKSPQKIANDIAEFLNGSGHDVANRMFTPEQRQLMRSYADTLRNAQEARDLIGEVSQATKPGEMPSGPMQQLADSVLGKNGRPDEAIFNAIDAYAKSGGRADINTLAKLVRALPAEERGNLAGSVIRNLGISPRTKEFSPDVFVSQWQSYTPQAKAILFGNAGPQRQAIDDIAAISARLKDVGRKFGNPSGTAQNAGFFGLATAGVAAAGQMLHGNPVPALTLIASVTGGSVAAKILAAPAGASSSAKWARTYEALVRKPSAHTLAAYQAASRNLANTANGLGSNINALDFMKALQAPSSGRAEDQQGVPRPPSQ